MDTNIDNDINIDIDNFNWRIYRELCSRLLNLVLANKQT